MDLKAKYGQWALITGASSGIGKAFAESFAEFGINLILVARRETQLAQLSKELSDRNKIKTIIAPIDLTEDNFLDKLISATDNQSIDILVNNAGFGSSGKFTHIDGNKEISMIKLNCIAPVILTRYYLPDMLKRNRGAVILLSSIAANQPSPFGITYAATKVFDSFIGEGLHYELKDSNVDVLTVKPGATTTEFQQNADYNPMKGARNPEQVVKTTLKSLGKKRVVTDGLLNKIMGLAAKIVPVRLAIYLAAKWTNERRKKK